MTTSNSLLQLPQAVDAEKCVIGALLLERRAIDVVMPVLSIEMFYDNKHRIIYEAILSLNKAQKPVDMVTVAQEIISVGKSDEVTPYDISNLTSGVSSSAHIEHHALIVKDKYVLRRIIEVGEAAKRDSYEGMEDVGDILAKVDRDIESLQGELIGGSDTKHIAPILKQSITEMYKRKDLAAKGYQSGINTGLSSLNKIANGWQSAELIIIAARPAMGKTAIALHFAKIAAQSGVPVSLFSLEMSDVSLANRLLLSETDIQPDHFKSGKLSNEETIEIEKASGRLGKLPIYVDDNASVSMSYIRSKCRLLHKQGKCRMVIIDYLQLAGGTGQKNRSREQEVSQMSREAKIIAKELNIPVLLLSQLNRESENRKDKRPLLSDLRESGAIEQDADMVILIHRPAYHDKEAEKGYGELIIAKYRNGATGILKFKHNDSLTKISDYGKESESGLPF